MSSSEFTEWIAYNDIEPGEPERTDWRNALLCQTISSTIPRKRGTRLPKLSEFILKFRNKNEGRGDAKSIMIKLRSFFALHKIPEKRKGDKK